MLPFTAITSRSNARVKTLRAAGSGKASEPGELVAIEGEHLISEARRSGLVLQAIYVREGSDDVLQRPLLRGSEAVEWHVLSRDVFASAVDTASPQGIVALIAIPEPGERVESPQTVLVLEDLQDPGNLGTLLRSAEAFGVDEVFVSSATVNAWNPKAVRASAGSVFRVKVVRQTLRAACSSLRQREVKLMAAVARADGATSCAAADLSGACAIMIGNEGAGLSAEALALAGERIHIPCAVESLNAAVAGSTLMYETMRQKIAMRQQKGRSQ